MKRFNFDAVEDLQEEGDQQDERKERDEKDERNEQDEHEDNLADYYYDGSAPSGAVENVLNGSSEEFIGNLDYTGSTTF